MGEQFTADPAFVAGMAVYAERLREFNLDAALFLRDHAGDHGGLTGVLTPLHEPIASLAANTFQRRLEHGTRLAETANELNVAAWLYHDTEQQNRRALEAAMQPVGPHPATGSTRLADYPNVAYFHGPTPPELQAPPPRQAELRVLVEEVGGWLETVDSEIVDLTGWSPLESVIGRLSGNWRELDRIGDAYAREGDAADDLARELERGVAQVDPHWDGAAGWAFIEYCTSLRRAFEWEASAGRILDIALADTADACEAAARKAIEKIKQLLETHFELDGAFDKLKFLLKKTPIVGWGWEAYEIRETVLATKSEVDKLVSEITQGIEALEEFMALIDDPVGYASEKSEEKIKEKLQPYLERIEQTSDAIGLGIDVATVLDTGAVTDTPEGGYSSGEGDIPWRGI